MRWGGGGAVDGWAVCRCWCCGSASEIGGWWMWVLVRCAILVRRRTLFLPTRYTVLTLALRLLPSPPPLPPPAVRDRGGARVAGGAGPDVLLHQRDAHIAPGAAAKGGLGLCGCGRGRRSACVLGRCGAHCCIGRYILSSTRLLPAPARPPPRCRSATRAARWRARCSWCRLTRRVPLRR